MGAPAETGRMAYGALVIEERLGITDEETAEQVGENPYLQYFLGLEEYRNVDVFDPSLMVHFRVRFTQEHHRLIDEKLILDSTAKTKDADKPQDQGKDDGPPENSGKLLVDATCTRADIKHPTSNEASICLVSNGPNLLFQEPLHLWLHRSSTPQP